MSTEEMKLEPRQFDPSISNALSREPIAMSDPERWAIDAKRIEMNHIRNPFGHNNQTTGTQQACILEHVRKNISIVALSSDEFEISLRPDFL